MGVSKVASLLLFTAAGACLVALTGCTTYGKVYVSHPQVFTRERLVVAREKEIQFLNKSLEAPVTSTFQGASDVRELSAFQNSLAATISPTAGVSNPTTAATTALSDTSKLMPGGAGSMDTAKNVSLSSVDRFNDAMAYRDAVNAVIREKELDDTHDRDGKTLYTLKFDTALIPGDRSKRPAVVKLTIQPQKFNENEFTEIYRLWVQQLSARRQDDENALSQRLYRGQISLADDGLLYYLRAGTDDFCQIATNKIQDTTLRAKYVEYVTKAALKWADLWTETPERRRQHVENVVTNTEERDYVFTGLQMALNAKYCHDFAGLASIDYNFDAYATNDTVVTCRMVSYNTNSDPHAYWWRQSEWSHRSQTTGALTLFTHVLTNWDQTAYVDSIDPQIYAQNISDVSSQTKLLELALTVNAAIAKPASVSDSMKYVHQSEKFLQAIKREPLALGFASGSEFGWLLGPPFGIEDGDATFLQAPIRQSFSVSIVVPAWVKNLTLTGIQCWIDKKGKEVETNNLPAIAVVLPRDMDALTSAIQRESSRLAPTLYLSGQMLQVATNGDQTLLVQGRELWRNPAVFVGSTRADTVDLLPDMRGVLAHFKTIPAFYEGSADLTVVTSFGADSLEKSIKILPASKTATNNPPLAKLTNSFAAYGGQPLGFTLSSMPSGFAGFSIKLSTKDVPGKWQNLADDEYSLPTNHLTLSIPIKITGTSAPPGPVVYTLDLGLRPTPSDLPASLFLGTNQPSFLYFPIKDQEKPQVPALTVAFNKDAPSPATVHLNAAAPATRAHLYQAYPGLEKSVGIGKALISFTVKTAKKKSQAFPLKEEGDGWTVNMSASASDLPAERYDAFTVEYQTPDDKTATLDVTGGPIIITRQ